MVTAGRTVLLERIAGLASSVIQVAGQLARRIKSYVKVGDVVTEGQKIGFISFGSQVVLVLPAVRVLEVGIGDITVDGETVIAR